jgi:hypothetical protein
MPKQAPVIHVICGSARIYTYGSTGSSLACNNIMGRLGECAIQRTTLEEYLKAQRPTGLRFSISFRLI